MRCHHEKASSSERLAQHHRARKDYDLVLLDRLAVPCAQGVRRKCIPCYHENKVALGAADKTFSQERVKMVNSDFVAIARVATPLGCFGAAVSPAGVGRLVFPDEPFDLCHEWVRRWAPRATVIDKHETLNLLQHELTLYFEGKLQRFTVPLDLRGTPFQLKVWQTLLTVPYGTTVSYSEIARRVGNPRAVRAVGGANNKNPVPIVVPCHRVIGSNGGLVGYGGGLELKQRLLDLERTLSSAGRY